MNRSREKRYRRIQELGSGAYGIVYLTLDTHENVRVAVKKISMGDGADGLHCSAIRELKMLQEIRHQNIILLKDVFLSRANLNLVYELMETDLETVINLPLEELHISPSDAKSIVFQILAGVERLHRGWVMHRDLKPGNVLLAPGKPIKVADFGLCKMFGNPSLEYSPQCVTRWYRPPELLYGATKYGPSVDIWSVGCIFAEVLLRIPLFAGSTDLEQLKKIFECLGTPSEESWPGMEALPTFIAFQKIPPTPLEQIFTAASPEAVDLLKRMLRINPSQRISAREALNHEYFRTPPLKSPIGSFSFQIPQRRHRLGRQDPQNQAVPQTFQGIFDDEG